MLTNKKQAIIYVTCVSLTTIIFLTICIGVKSKAGWITDFDNYWMEVIYAAINVQNTNLFQKITNLGDVTMITYLTALVTGVLLKNKSNTVVWLSMTVIMGAINIPQTLKRMIKRERPMNGIRQSSGYSFPSGHSTAAAVFYTVLIILGFIYLKHNLSKLILAIALLAIIFLVMYSRVYLGVHYPSDVIGGFFLGVSITLWSFGIYYRITGSRIGT